MSTGCGKSSPIVAGSGSRDKDGGAPNVRVFMVFIVFSRDYRAYIGISHRGTSRGTSNDYPLIGHSFIARSNPSWSLVHRVDRSHPLCRQCSRLTWGIPPVIFQICRFLSEETQIY